MQIGVMRVAGDAGAGTTVLRIRTHWPGLELREAPGDWTVVDGLLHLSVSAEFAHVRVSFVRSRQPDCEDRWPVEYDIDVALVPSDRELSVGPAARR
jgi:hypothetical protein